jgi:hypothetical protein
MRFNAAQDEQLCSLSLKAACTRLITEDRLHTEGALAHRGAGGVSLRIGSALRAPGATA